MPKGSKIKKKWYKKCLSFLNWLSWVVSQKSSFYCSKTMICDDVVFQKAAQSNGKDMQNRW